MTALAERSVRQIFEDAASTAPAPGAGSVMALAAMWGAGLALKAVRITHRRGLGAEETRAAEAELERLAGLLAQDAEDDAAAFTTFVTALRLPKDDPDRSAALSRSAAAAAEGAVRALEHARAGVEVCRTLEGRIAPVMAADLDAGAVLLRAAARTASENARESLASVRAEAVREGVLRRLAEAARL